MKKYLKGLVHHNEEGVEKLAKVQLQITGVPLER